MAFCLVILKNIFINAQCINYNREICQQCSFNYYLDFQNLKNNNFCYLKKNESLIRKVLIVKDNSTIKFYELFDQIYSNVLEAFTLESKKSEKYISNNLRIFISNEDHYINNKNDEFKNSIFFKNQKINITIEPFFGCINNSVISCEPLENQKQLPTIIFQNYLFQLSISYYIKISKIIFRSESENLNFSNFNLTFCYLIPIIENNVFFYPSVNINNCIFKDITHFKNFIEVFFPSTLIIKNSSFFNCFFKKNLIRMDRYEYFINLNFEKFFIQIENLFYTFSKITKLFELENDSLFYIQNYEGYVYFKNILIYNYLSNNQNNSLFFINKTKLNSYIFNFTIINSNFDTFFFCSESYITITNLSIINCKWRKFIFFLENVEKFYANNLEILKNLGHEGSLFLYSINSFLTLSSSKLLNNDLFSFSLYNSYLILLGSILERINLGIQSNILDHSIFLSENNIWNNFDSINEIFNCFYGFQIYFINNKFFNFSSQKSFISGNSLDYLTFLDSEIGKFTNFQYFLFQQTFFKKIIFEGSYIFNFTLNIAFIYIINKCEFIVNNSKFYNHVYYSIKSLFFLSIQIGTVVIDSSYFNQIIFYKGGNSLFLLKNANITINNTVFLINGFRYMINVSEILTIEYAGLIFLWKSYSILFYNNLFLNDQTVSLFSGFILSSLNKIHAYICKCYFIELDKDKIYYGMGIIFSNSPFISIVNNSFINLKCSENDFLHKNGPISLQFINSYSKIINNLVAIIENNYFYNCICHLGGSMGIINYGNVIFKSNIIEKSYASFGGGIVVICSSVVIFEKNTFIDLIATEASGIYFTKINKIFINLLLIKSAIFEKGTINILRVDYLFLEKVVIRNIYNNLNGGFIDLNGGNLLLSHGEFYNITSLGEGGLFICRNEANLSIYNITSFISFSSIGGIIQINHAYSVIIEFSSFSQSNSIQSGACFYIELTPKVIFKNIYIKNSKTLSNGIIFLKNLESVSNYELENIVCINNSALQGTCIFLESYGSIRVFFLYSIKNIGSIIHISSFLFISIDLINIYFEKTTSYKYIIFLENIIGKCLNFIIINKIIKDYVINIFNADNFLFENSIFIHENKTNAHVPSYIFIDISNLTLNYIKFYQLTISNNDNNYFSLNFIYLHHSYLNLGFSNFSNNYNLNSSLILMEFSSIKMASLSFTNNIGIILIAIDSQVYIFNSIFNNNYCYSKDFPNEFYIYSKYFYSHRIFNAENSIFNYSKGFNSLINGYNEIKYLNCLMDGNKYGSGLLLSDSINLIINNCVFKNMHYTQGSVINLINSENIVKIIKIIINYSNFFNNTGILGGVFYIQGSNNIYILNSGFDNNLAYYHDVKNDKSYGFAGVGLIYGNKSNVSIINCVFTNNFAFSFISTIYSSVFIYSENLYFFNNSDSRNFSNSIFCHPWQIRIDSSPNEIISGESFYFSFRLIDNYENILKTQEFSTAIIVNEDIKTKSTIINKVSKLTKDGVFVFNNLIIKTMPNSNFTISIKLSLNELDSIINEEITYSLKFFVRPCLIGEIYKDDFSCLKCPSNYYSVEDPMKNLEGKLLCKACQKNAICVGRNYLIPKFGYWRHSSDSELIINCIIQEACLGVPSSYVSNDALINQYNNYSKDLNIIQGMCREGHHKMLCYECSLKYGKIFNENKCELCEQYYIVNLLKVLASILAILFVLFLNVEISLNKKNEETEKISVIYKIFINHIQKISLITVFYFKDLVDVLKEFFSFINIFSFINQDAISNECLLKHFFGEIDNIYLFKSIIVVTLPLIFSIFFIFIFSCFSLRQKKIKLHLIKKLLIVFIISGFLFYPSIIKSGLGVLNCISLSDKTNLVYLYNSPNLECWTSFHYYFLFFIVIVGIIFWGILYPIIICYIIKKNIDVENHNHIPKINIQDENHKKIKILENVRTLIVNDPKNNDKIILSSASNNQKNINFIKKKDVKLKTEEKKQQLEQTIANNNLTFFYKDYKKDYYFWEIIIFYEKFFLCLLPNIRNFISDELVNLLFTFILFFYLLLIMINIPFKLHQMNNLEMASTFISIGSRFLIVYSINSSSIIISSISSIILGLGNIFFLLLTVYYIFKIVNWKKIIKEVTNQFSLIKIKNTLHKVISVSIK